jgi:hypothetical protein
MTSARALRSAGCGRIIGVDADPHAEGLALCDEAVVGDWLATDLRAGAIVGNPPFGGPNSADERARGIPAYLGAHHALHAVDRASLVAMILPAAWLVFEPDNDGDGLAPMPLWRRAGRVPDVVYPIAGRAWGDHLREAALYVWCGDHDGLRIGRPIYWRM